MPAIEPISKSDAIAQDPIARWEMYAAWRTAQAEPKSQAEKSSDGKAATASPALPGDGKSTSTPPGDAKPISPTAAKSGDGKPTPTTSVTGKPLTEEQKNEVKELQARDAEVRRHEQAHMAAAGTYAMGGPRYTFKQGPDGRTYVTKGEVIVDISPVEGDPNATIQKAEQLRRAALAPMEPSSQDRQTAAAASQMGQEARSELMSEVTSQVMSGASSAPTVSAAPSEGTDTGDQSAAAQATTKLSDASQPTTEESQQPQAHVPEGHVLADQTQKLESDQKRGSARLADDRPVSNPARLADDRTLNNPARLADDRTLVRGTRDVYV